jgi:hypothetical protein
MSGREIALRVGEFLIGRAVRGLPAEARSEWFRTLAAELPAILDDPDVRPAFRRHTRMLRYAADSIRGAWCLRGMSAGAVPTVAGAVIQAAAAVSVGAAAILTVGVITTDIRLTLVLSGFALGGLLLISAFLFARVIVIARARRAASPDDAPPGGA